jgi:hypothetical protein
MRYVVAFVRFWYEFIVGDDWRMAAGVVVALGATAVLSSAVPAWWVMPVAVVAILYGSLWRATRSSSSV